VSCFDILLYVLALLPFLLFSFISKFLIYALPCSIP